MSKFYLHNADHVRTCLSSLLGAVEDFIEKSMPSKGDKEYLCQKLCVQNSLNALQRSIGSIEQPDLKTVPNECNEIVFSSIHNSDCIHLYNADEESPVFKAVVSGTLVVKLDEVEELVNEIVSEAILSELGDYTVEVPLYNPDGMKATGDILEMFFFS